MKPVRKAVFPVAGLGTRLLPATKAMPKEMLTLLDKPLIQWVVEEAKAAGIEEFIFVTSVGKEAIVNHFMPNMQLMDALVAKKKDKQIAAVNTATIAEGHVHTAIQDRPLGLGHAVNCARDIVGREPFAVILPDVILAGGRGGLAELVDAYNTHGGNVITVNEVPRSETGSYGIAAPGNDDGKTLAITGLVEKPSPETAPSNLAVTGRYILQPEVFDYLAEGKTGAGGEIQLTDAMLRLIGQQPFHGVRFSGQVHDCGHKLGLAQAVVAMGMADAEIGAQLRNYTTHIMNKGK